MSSHGPLRVRWLGRVPYREALAVQTALFEHGTQNHLLLLEHPHVFTHGPRADLVSNLLVQPEAVGAELVAVKRGGDITYHGPGQLVGYPVVSVANSLGASDHVCAIQRLVVGTLQELGVADVGCLDEYPGVWVGVSGPNPRKICAIGVRLAGGRTMHGFALNVRTDLRYMRDHIVPCGIGTKPVTSLAEEGLEVSVQEVADIVARRAADVWGGSVAERQDVAWKHQPADLAPFSRGEGPGETGRALARLEAAGVSEGLSISSRKPEWLRPKVQLGTDVLAMKRTVREHGLVTVCEEAGCPNLSECWAAGTATFMVLGERCTRACGF
ncbi:MAG: lipoyl(octanoyl) transferase LipB, partial [Actinomycetota bacterium]